MSYTGRKNYTPRHERHRRYVSRAKMALVIGIIAAIIYAYKNRIYIREWWASVID